MKVLISVALAGLLFIGCSEEESAKKVDSAAQSAKESVTEVQKIAQETIKVTQKVSEAVVEKSAELRDQAQEVVEKTVESSKEIASKAKEVTSEAVETTKKTINEVAKEVEVATQTTDNGAALYKACAGCHGVSGEKPALGKSQVIQGWSASKVEHALNGYKDGSYGGTMKAIMKGQSTKLSDVDIKEVSEYISKL